MVKGHERKAYQPSSSAKAAQLLSSTAPKPAGLGFGGFSGATPVGDIAASVTGSQAPSSATDVPALSGELDSEITQLLKSLSKKDAVTKVKALQKLKAVVATKEPATVSACLPAWGYIYNKLVMDNSRATRTETSAVLAAMAKVVGKGLAPFLKLLAGSWWLAQFDLHAEAAAAARDAFQIAFHGPKQKEALLFTRSEVLQLLRDNLTANAEALGDARKESPEELAERHERVLAGSLLALSSLLDLLVSTQPHEAANERDAQSEVIVQLESLLTTQGFLKRVLGFKSEHVRTAAYTLLSHICYRAPQLLAKHMQTVAPLVLGAFQEQQAAAHSAMWEMILAFVKAHPPAWHAVDMRKAVLPRLLTFLRQGCYGSGASSYPAMLPLLHVLPKGLLGPDPSIVNDLLAAMWTGLTSQMAGKARDAGGDAFSECLAWTLLQAERLTDGAEAAQSYAVTLLQASVGFHAVPAALQGTAGIAATAAAAITKAVAQTNTQGTVTWLTETVQQQLGLAIMDVLTPLCCGNNTNTQSASVSPFTRASSLVDSLQQVADQKLIQQHVAGPIAAALVQPVQQGSSSVEASSLLSSLVKHFGADVAAGGGTSAKSSQGHTTGRQEAVGLSLESILQSSLSGPLEGPAAHANADLLLSCIQGKPTPAVELANILQQLVHSPDPAADARTGLASAITEITGKVYSPETEATTGEQEAGVRAGHALALLLVQQLLASLQRASQALQWHCSELDELACQLADMHNSPSPDTEQQQQHTDSHAPLDEQEAQSPLDSVIQSPESADDESSSYFDKIRERTSQQLAEVPTTFDNTAHQPAQLLGLLLKGKDTTSLLSDATAHHVLSKLKAIIDNIEAGVHDGLLQALVTLDGCLYSQAVSAVPSLHQLQHELITDMFQLSWPVTRAITAERSYAILDQEQTEPPWDLSNWWWQQRLEEHYGSNGLPPEFDPQEDKERLLHLQAPVVTIAHWKQGLPKEPMGQAIVRGNALWEAGAQSAVLLAGFSADDQAALKHSLYKRLQSGYASTARQYAGRPVGWRARGSGGVYGDTWWQHWAVLAQEVLTATCTSAEPDDLLDLLLYPTDGVQGVYSRGSVAEGLCHVLGYDAVLFKQQEPRYAIAADMMVANEERENLEAYMFKRVCRDGSTQHNASLDGAIPKLLQHVLHVLTEYQSFDLPDDGRAVTQGHGDTLSTRSVDALLSLMNKFITESSTGMTGILSHWFRSAAAQLGSNILDEDILKLQGHAATALRASKEAVTHSGLDQLAVEMCQKANAMPPIAAVDPRNQQQQAACVHLLTNIYEIFIMGRSYYPRQFQEPGVSTAAERQALLAVVLKQVQGEASAARAAAAAQRATSVRGTAASRSRSNRGITAKLARGCVGRLVLCALMYCQEEMSEQDWRTLLGRVQAVVSSTIVPIEDSTEHLTSTVISVMKQVFKLDPHTTPTATMEAFLRTACRPGPTSEAIKKVLVEAARATDQPSHLASHDDGCQSDYSSDEELPQSLQTFEKLQNNPGSQLPDDCVASFRALDVCLSRHKTTNARPLDAAPADIATDVMQQSYADVLRIIFTVGIIRPMQFYGARRSPADPAALHIESHLEHIAYAAASEASMDAVFAAAQGVDAWSSETGVDAATSLIELSLNSHSGLHRGALALLVTPCMLSRLTTASAAAEAEEENNAPAASRGDMYKSLLRAGIRPRMANVLSKPPRKENSDWYEDLKEHVLAWALLLAHILEMPHGDPGKAFLAQALRAEYELVPTLLNALIPYLPLKAKSRSSKAKPQFASGAKAQVNGSQKAGASQQQTQSNLAQALRDGLTRDMSRYHDEYEGADSMRALAIAVFRAALHALPASARAWFGDLRDRGLAASVEAYTAEQESPLLLQREFQRVQTAPAAPDMDNFSLKANPVTREVVAVMEIEDGAVLEMVIKLPASSPLKRAEVVCRRRVGVTESKLRKWLLSVTAFLANQNGSVAEAMTLWQRNVQKEFEGVEECLICYSIVSASDGKVPRLQCKTCSKRFHGSCLYKWFQSSGKSNCPHCQSPW